MLVAREKSHGFSGNIPVIIKSCIKYSFFFSVLSSLILVVLCPYIAKNTLNGSVPVYILYLFLICLPLCSISSCLNGYFMAMEKMFTIVISQVLEVIVQIIVVYVFFLLNKFDTTINICLALILGMALSDMCSFLFLAYKYYIDYINLHKQKSTSVSFTKEICKISLPVAFTTYIKSGLSTLKNSLIPIALVSYGFHFNEALSYYGIISSTVMSLILFPFTLIQSYSSLLIPELSTYDTSKSLKKITYITKKSIIVTFIFSVIVTIVLVAFSKWIDTNIYKSLDIEIYIKILAPIIIYIYMDNVIDSILKSLNLQTYVMLINIIDLIVSIAFINFLIPMFGIKGYIFILYFSEAFNFLLSLFILSKRLKKS